jgi:hypothetical protein
MAYLNQDSVKQLKAEIVASIRGTSHPSNLTVSVM